MARPKRFGALGATARLTGVWLRRNEDCLTRLSQKARDIVRLAYAEARSHREIAAHLGTTEANARVLRHRTLRALHDCMSAHISWQRAS